MRPARRFRWGICRGRRSDGPPIGPLCAALPGRGTVWTAGERMRMDFKEIIEAISEGRGVVCEAALGCVSSR